MKEQEKRNKDSAVQEQKKTINDISALNGPMKTPELLKTVVQVRIFVYFTVEALIVDRTPLYRCQTSL